MGEGQRESAASPLNGWEGYLSLWGPADSARVPHLPVFDELGSRLQTGAVRQIFIQKQGSHSGHQGGVRDPGTPSFKCTEHCWKQPWFLIKPIKKAGPQIFFFLVFAAQNQNFLEKLGSSSSFHIEVVPTFSTTPEQPATHSHRLDYKDGIFDFSSWKKKTLLHPNWALRYPAQTDAHPGWRLLWTGRLGIRGRGGDGALGWGRTWGSVWGSRGGQGRNLGWRWGHVC